MSRTNAANDDKRAASREPAVTYHDSELRYFQAERDRLQFARDKYLSETKKPERKEYSPDIFTCLEPYTDLVVYNKALDAPTETPRYQYKTRNTADGLCDPWVSYYMDVEFDEERSPRSPPTSASSTTRSSTEGRSTGRGSEKNENSSTRRAKSSKEGSSTGRASEKDNRTRSAQKRDKSQSSRQEKKESVPLFPTVQAVPNEMTGKQLNYSHVPKLRDELRKTYSANAERKIEQNYKLTKSEFYTRQLNRVTEYHPDSWPIMRQAYFAYLQNNLGSKRAVHECVREVEKENDTKKEEKNKTTERSNNTERVDSAKEENNDTKGDEKNKTTERSKNTEKIGSAKRENNDTKGDEKNKTTEPSKHTNRVGSAREENNDAKNVEAVHAHD